MLFFLHSDFFLLGIFFGGVFLGSVFSYRMIRAADGTSIIEQGISYMLLKILRQSMKKQTRVIFWLILIQTPCHDNSERNHITQMYSDPSISLFSIKIPGARNPSN